MSIPFATVSNCESTEARHGHQRGISNPELAIIATPSGDKRAILKLSEKLQAPHLRHFAR